MLSMNIHRVKNITVKPINEHKEGNQPVLWRDIEIETEQGTIVLTLFPEKDIHHSFYYGHELKVTVKD